MKYLLQAIDARRDCVRLSDHELRDLLIEVRNGKDDRIEFTESMIRLLEELKSSEHATAFLTKVAKRDAPDYYDVIKNPMDLGTMMRNVRQGRFKSKAQFMRDLDLIWDNCLTYNSEPTHPLRRSVQVLRTKANHLLTYVNDTNDVKEALNQWQASLGLQRRPSEDPQASLDGTNIGEQSSVTGRDRISTSHGGAGAGLGRLNASAMIEMPFEQRPALLRTSDGMVTFERLNASLAALDEDFARRYLNADAGPSSRTLDTSADQGLSAVASLDMLKTLEGPQGGVLRMALTAPPEATRGPATVHGDGTGRNGVMQQDGDLSVPYPLEPEDVEQEVDATQDPGAAWWNSMAHPSLLPSGVTPLPASERTANKRIQYIGGKPAKRRRRAFDNETASMTGEGERAKFGGLDALERNVKTIVRLRRTHTKFGRLNNHIESGQPIPADLGVVSSDEEGEGEDGSGEQKAEEANAPKARRKAPDVLMLPINEMAGNPHRKLGGEGATGLLQNKTGLLLAHAGFDGSQKAAADVLADVAGEFIMNVGRTLRTYTDRFAQEMSVEEMVLHTLYENGGMDVRSLESYVADDVVRYGNKMSDLLRKLRTSYRDTLANSDLTMADEAAYFGSIGAGQAGSAGSATHEAGEGDEHLLRGGIAGEFADEDFFGFKDMGLDDELGIDVGRQLAAMPSRVFSRRAHENGVQGGIGPKARVGGFGDSQSQPALEFEPPPPFVPLSEASIAAQIGLLRPFYRDLLRTRGQWQRTGQHAETTNGTDGPERLASVKAEPDTGEGDRTEADKDAYLILPDEEQERPRYKVPPTGKMPRRATKQRSSQQSNVSTTNTGANGTSFGQLARKSGTQQINGKAKEGATAANGGAPSKSKSKSKKKDADRAPPTKQHTAQTVTVS